MHRRHLALPRVWLVTDERQGEALWPALARLPRQAGVIVRHYTLPLSERRSLARRIVRRGFFVAFAGSEADARRAGARAVYGVGRPGMLPRLHPVHDRTELVGAFRAGAALVLLSPAFPTRTHPGAPALGPVRFGLMARQSPVPVIALGGVNAGRFRRLRALGAAGWAAIDGLAAARVRT